MQRTAVTSSQLKSVGFENGTMHIEFHPRKGSPEGTPGPVYSYTGPKVQEHYDRLILEQASQGGSVGSYFIKQVKPFYDVNPLAESKYERVTDV